LTERQLTPAPAHAVRHALRSPEGNRQVRWTGYVFGVYPLYDVYDNPRGTFVLRRKSELFLAHGRLRSPSHPLVRAEKWWSWTGSNRRPEACKATALPTELQPLTFRVSEKCRVVGLGRFELPTSPLSRARSNQLSYRPVREPIDYRRPKKHPWEERETKTAISRFM
jgi:hypothetical protein